MDFFKPCLKFGGGGATFVASSVTLFVLQWYLAAAVVDTIVLGAVQNKHKNLILALVGLPFQCKTGHV